jgi:hypothetical protein
MVVSHKGGFQRPADLQAAVDARPLARLVPEPCREQIPEDNQTDSHNW